MSPPSKKKNDDKAARGEGITSGGGIANGGGLPNAEAVAGKFWIPALAVLVLATLLQGWIGLAQDSVTWDEQTFIPAGFAAVETGDFRLNREQPPLMKLWMGLPQLWKHATVPTDHPSWTEADRIGNTQWAFGHQFLSVVNDDGPELVRAARRMIVPLACVLVVVVFLFARALYGPLAGLLAALLATTSPNLLAHGRLATTDFGVTLFVTLTMYLTWRALERGTWPRFVAVGASLGLAMLAKFSGVFLLPIVPLAFVLDPWLRPSNAPESATGSRLEAAKRALLPAGFIAAIALLVTSFGYLAPGRVDLYFRNMGEVGFNVNPDAMNYLLGELSRERFPHYFLVAFLVKTPVWTLGLLAARWIFDPLHRADGKRNLLLLGAPIALFFLIVSWKASQVGIRYLLPIYPLLFVYAAGIVGGPGFARAKSGAGARVAAGLTGALAVYAVIGAVRAWPHHVSYFNDAAGGPRHGIRYLAASNVDWGQDFIRLRTWMEERGVESVRLLYSENFDPGLYGVRFERIETPAPIMSGEPGVYVVGVKEANRARRRNPDGTSTSFLDMREPDDRVAWSLLVYEVPGR